MGTVRLPKMLVLTIDGSVSAQLFHKFTDEHPGCGGHAFSRDGRSWTLHSAHAYTTTISTTLGTEHTFFRRERHVQPPAPHIGLVQ